MFYTMCFVVENGLFFMLMIASIAWRSQKKKILSADFSLSENYLHWQTDGEFVQLKNSYDSSSVEQESVICWFSDEILKFLSNFLFLHPIDSKPCSHGGPSNITKHGISTVFHRPFINCMRNFAIPQMEQKPKTKKKDQKRTQTT